MNIIKYVQFLWALWKLLPEAKALWLKIDAEWKKLKGDDGKVTVSDFVAIVKSSFDNANMTPISELQTGLKSDGSVK